MLFPSMQIKDHRLRLHVIVCGEAQFLGRRTSSWSLDYNSEEKEPETVNIFM